MPHKISRGRVGAGRLAGPGDSKALMAMSGTVARTDTTAKNLFKLPVGAELVGVHVGGAIASNAATTATVSVGKTGTDDYFVTSVDVKAAATGAAANGAPTKNPGAQGGVQVTGKYAETGTASTAGGPWTVTALFLL